MRKKAWRFDFLAGEQTQAHTWMYAFPDIPQKVTIRATRENTRPMVAVTDVSAMVVLPTPAAQPVTFTVMAEYQDGTPEYYTCPTAEFDDQENPPPVQPSVVTHTSNLIAEASAGQTVPMEPTPILPVGTWFFIFYLIARQGSQLIGVQTSGVMTVAAEEGSVISDHNFRVVVGTGLDFSPEVVLSVSGRMFSVNITNPSDQAVSYTGTLVLHGS